MRNGEGQFLIKCAHAMSHPSLPFAVASAAVGRSHR